MWKFFDSLAFSILGLSISIAALFIGLVIIVSFGTALGWATFGIGVFSTIFFMRSIVKIEKHKAQSKYGSPCTQSSQRAYAHEKNNVKTLH